MSEHWKVVKTGAVLKHDTAEELWDAATSYFSWCDAHPIDLAKKVRVGKDAGSDLSESKHRPYTVKGLCLHCGITEEFLRIMYKASNDYSFVISRIMYIIQAQNIEMAMVDHFNPVFVAKLLSLDKQEEPAESMTIKIVKTESQRLKSSEDQVEDSDFRN